VPAIEINPKRMLLIRPSALGDVCRSVPVAAELKRLFPEARLDWLVQDSFADAVRAHPAVDGVVLFARNRLKDGLGAKRTVVRDLRRTLREARYDLVVDAQGLLRSGLMAWATGAAVRIGHGDARECGWLGYTHAVPRRWVHTVDHMLSLLEPLGRVMPAGGSTGRLPAAWQLACPAEALTWAAEQPWAGGGGRDGGRNVVLAPTSRWAAKAWPIERFDALAARLLGRGLCERVLVVGGPGEQAQCRPLLERAAADPRVVDLVGRTSIGQLMAVIRGAALVVANDSAAVHMAAGFDRPLVALYGPTDLAKVGPFLRGADAVQVRRESDTLDHKSAAGVVMMQRIGLEVVEQMAAARLAGSGR
jgi:heptosyltransferase-1/heptosyltransferase-2